MSHFNKLPAELQFEILTLAVRTSGVNGSHKYVHYGWIPRLQGTPEIVCAAFSTVSSLHNVCNTWRQITDEVLYQYLVYIMRRESKNWALCYQLQAMAAKARTELLEHLFAMAAQVNVPSSLRGKLVHDTLQDVVWGNTGEFQMCFLGEPSLTMRYVRLDTMAAKVYSIVHNVGSLKHRLLEIYGPDRFNQRWNKNPRSSQRAVEFADQQAVRCHAEIIATRDYGDAQLSASLDSMKLLLYYWRKRPPIMPPMVDEPTLHNQHCTQREETLFRQAFQELMAKECLTVFDHPDTDDSSWIEVRRFMPVNVYPKRTLIQWPPLD